MKSDKQKYKEVELDFRTLCNEIEYYSGVLGYGKTLEITEKLDQIKKYQEELYNKFDELLGLSISRFSQVKKYYENWKLNNKGFDNFSAYLIKELESFTGGAVNKFDKISSRASTAGALTFIPTVGLVAASFAVNSPAISIALVVNSSLAAACLATSGVAKHLDSKYANEYQLIINDYYKFNEIDLKLRKALELAEVKYSELSKDVKSGLTLEKANFTRESLDGKLNSLSNNIAKLSKEYTSLEEKQEELDEKISYLKNVNNPNDLIGLAEDVNKANEDYATYKNERNKKSPFYSEVEQTN